MARQLVFDLPRRTSMSRGDFFVSEANAAAIGLLDAPGTWPNGRLVITGAEGAGKTHLAHVWSDATGAEIIDAAALATADIAGLGSAAHLVIEDIDRLGRAGEEPLFHLINLMMEGAGRLLMTARAAPVALPVALPDLASRLQGSGVAALDLPDDALLTQILIKLFADRQINPEPALIPWLVTRLERSFAAAERAVDTIDHAALTEGKNVTRTLAREVLAL